MLAFALVEITPHCSGIRQWGYNENVSNNLIHLPIAYTTLNMISIVSDTYADTNGTNSIMGSRPYELQNIQISQFSNISGKVEIPGYFYFLSIGR